MTWYLKDRHFHRNGRIIYDKLNHVVVCELSEPESEYIEHKPLGIGSKDRDLAEEHAQLIMAAPYAVRACRLLAESSFADKDEEIIEKYEEAIRMSIDMLRKLEERSL
jgi:hypothetical protein